MVISILFSIFDFCVTVLDFVFHLFFCLNVLYTRTLDCFFPLTVCVMFLCFGLVFLICLDILFLFCLDISFYVWLFFENLFDFLGLFFSFCFLMYIYVLKNQNVILLDLFLSFEFLFKIVGFIFGRCVFSFFGIFFLKR